LSTDPQEKNSLVPEQPQIIRWRCPNCGQTLFTAADDYPPDICDYCKDMTTWQRVQVEVSADRKTT
jgi:uncharacterized OB-fold protein